MCLSINLLVLIGLVLALLQEGAHALLLIRRLEAAAEQLFLDDDGLVHVHLKALVDGLLAGADSDRRVLGDGLGQLLGGGQQLVQGIDGVDQTDAVGGPDAGYRRSRG